MREPCSSCRAGGECHVPDACHQPEPQPPRLPKTFQPKVLTGPYRRLRRHRSLPRLIAYFLGLAVVLAVGFLFLYR